MKQKSIDSTFEKKTQEKGRGRVIYQSQTESGSQVWEMPRRNAPSSLACFGKAVTWSTFTCNDGLFKKKKKKEINMHINLNWSFSEQLRLVSTSALWGDLAHFISIILSLWSSSIIPISLAQKHPSVYINLMFSYYMHGLIPPSSIPNCLRISKSTPHFTNQNV